MLANCIKNPVEPLPQLEFRREIVNAYLQSYGTPPKGAGWSSTSKSSISFNRVADYVRYDRMDHLVEFISDKKKGEDALGKDVLRAQGLCVKNVTLAFALSVFRIFIVNS
jgi:hypothetical protein